MPEKSSGEIQLSFDTSKGSAWFGKYWPKINGQFDGKGHIEKPKADGPWSYKFDFSFSCACESALTTFKAAFKGAYEQTPDDECDQLPRQGLRDVRELPAYKATQLSCSRRAVEIVGATTDLDMMLSGVPWHAGDFEYGLGIDAITGESTSSSPLKPFDVKPSAGMGVLYSGRFVTNSVEMSNEVDVATKGDYNIESVNVTESTSYLSKISYSEMSLTIVAKYSVIYDNYDVATGSDYQLTDEAKQLFTEPAKFRNKYGDYFVYGGRRASEFVATYGCSASSATDLTNFQTSLGVDVAGILSKDGVAKLSQAAAQYGIQITSSVTMAGVEEKPPLAPTSPEAVLKLLAWFSKVEVGRLAYAKLVHYSFFDSAYPQTLPVDPALFVELRSLYRQLWLLRARFGSLPRVYRDRYEQEYEQLRDGVTANKSRLPLDDGLRNRLIQQSAILLGQLSEVIDRRDFYNLVRTAAAIEPHSGVSHSAGQGQNRWLYGYSAYPASAAIVIHNNNSDPLRFHPSWHVGWRSGVLEIGPNQNKLIVGWEVISNWNDGSNGEWSKDDGQILLNQSGRGVVHVKSKYDRGCDWSLVYYFVDAADYQFQNE